MRQLVTTPFADKKTEAPTGEPPAKVPQLGSVLEARLCPGWLRSPCSAWHTCPPAPNHTLTSFRLLRTVLTPLLLAVSCLSHLYYPKHRHNALLHSPGPMLGNRRDYNTVEDRTMWTIKQYSAQYTLAPLPWGPLSC